MVAIPRDKMNYHKVPKYANVIIIPKPKMCRITLNIIGVSHVIITFEHHVIVLLLCTISYNKRKIDV